MNKKAVFLWKRLLFGVPGGSRTHGLSLRRRTLYPAELRKRCVVIITQWLPKINFWTPFGWFCKNEWDFGTRYARDMGGEGVGTQAHSSVVLRLTARSTAQTLARKACLFLYPFQRLRKRKLNKRWYFAKAHTNSRSSAQSLCRFLYMCTHVLA